MWSRVAFPVGAVACSVHLWPSRPAACEHGRGKVMNSSDNNASWLFKRRFMNRADEALMKIGHAMRPGFVTSRYSPTQTEVIRIALTGGPCAGKSSALEHITKAATSAGYDVYAAPEVATLLLNAGCSHLNPEAPGFDERLFAFQKGIMQLQLQAERVFTLIAGCTGRPSIIIFDRGLLDGKAYCTQEMWDRLIAEVEASAPGLDFPRKMITEEYMMARYNMVVHLVTAADGAVEFYKWGKTTDDSGNVVIRGERPEEAVALDKRVRAAYSNHPRLALISNGPDGFEGKLRRCTQAILEVASEIHPQYGYLSSRIVDLQAENEKLRAELSRLSDLTAK
eukprot:TRINITY_DN4786_c2_g3_i1.p1 TRINITY_DN4786_c2_g3~~TRINITY_DN4786_c2_g3_i1.p1  ORF type:complete len:338 (-),score=70.48 TRINITY_DN4786_c2_g3_i1:377-1390(-)